MDLWALQYCDSITELTTKSIDYTVYPVYRFIVQCLPAPKVKNALYMETPNEKVVERGLNDAWRSFRRSLSRYNEGYLGRNLHLISQTALLLPF